MEEPEDNISIFFSDAAVDEENITSELDLKKILKDLEKIETSNSSDSLNSLVVYYELNYNIKQLFLICDYYKISKNLRVCKSNKLEIIESLVLFEMNPENFEIVIKRKQLWFYINELKNDKFMKKYVFW